MTATATARGGGDREADKALLAVLAGAVVLLLVVTNVQLWRLADAGRPPQRAAAPVTSTLPPPVQGTSNSVLTRQMRRLSRSMTVPLNGMRSQLVGLQGLGAAQEGVAEQIGAMGASIRSFGGVQGQLAQMSGGLGTMVASTSSMSRGMVAMGRNMSATRKSTLGMVRVMKRLEGGIGATSASSKEASEGIAAMRDSMSKMSGALEATAANGKEMTASLARLNQHMTDMVELFCVAFGSSQPACGGEAE